MAEVSGLSNDFLHELGIDRAPETPREERENIGQGDLSDAYWTGQGYPPDVVEDADGCRWEKRAEAPGMVGYVRVKRGASHEPDASAGGSSEIARIMGIAKRHLDEIPSWQDLSPAERNYWRQVAGEIAPPPGRQLRPIWRHLWRWRSAILCLALACAILWVGWVRP